MQIEIKYRTSATVAHCHLQPGEKLTSESGALMAISPNMTLTTSTHSRGKGGILKGLKRMLSGESFFLNHIEAKSEGDVWLSTPLPGDIMVRELKGDSLILSGGAYVASSDGVHIDLKFQGLRGLFTGENLFWIHAEGAGPVILSAFGEIYPVQVNGEYIVDTGHIVAFEPTLNFTISKSGSSWLHSFMGGEGLVCRFKGQGTVWCQSHNPQAFGYELSPMLRVKSR